MSEVAILLFEDIWCDGKRIHILGLALPPAEEILARRQHGLPTVRQFAACDEILRLTAQQVIAICLFIIIWCFHGRHSSVLILL